MNSFHHSRLVHTAIWQVFILWRHKKESIFHHGDFINATIREWFITLQISEDFFREDRFLHEGFLREGFLQEGFLQVGFFQEGFFQGGFFQGGFFQGGFFR